MFRGLSLHTDLQDMQGFCLRPSWENLANFIIFSVTISTIIRGAIFAILDPYNFARGALRNKPIDRTCGKYFKKKLHTVPRPKEEIATPEHLRRKGNPERQPYKRATTNRTWYRQSEGTSYWRRLLLRAELKGRRRCPKMGQTRTRIGTDWSQIPRSLAMSKSTIPDLVQTAGMPKDSGLQNRNHRHFRTKYLVMHCVTRKFEKQNAW